MKLPWANRRAVEAHIKDLQNALDRERFRREAAEQHMLELQEQVTRLTRECHQHADTNLSLTLRLMAADKAKQEPTPTLAVKLMPKPMNTFAQASMKDMMRD